MGQWVTVLVFCDPWPMWPIMIYWPMHLSDLTHWPTASSAAGVWLRFDDIPVHAPYCWTYTIEGRLNSDSSWASWYTVVFMACRQCTTVSHQHAVLSDHHTSCSLWSRFAASSAFRKPTPASVFTQHLARWPSSFFDCCMGPTVWNSLPKTHSFIQSYYATSLCIVTLWTCIRRLTKYKLSFINLLLLLLLWTSASGLKWVSDA